MAVTNTGRVTSSTFPLQSTAASLSLRSGVSAALAASFRSPILRTPRRRWEWDKRCDIACVISIGFVALHAISHLSHLSHVITCDHNAISRDHMRLHAIACDCKGSHAISKKNLMSTTVRFLENASGTRSGTESLPKVFLHDNCEQISYNFFRLSQKGRNEKWDSFYAAKRVSSVHSCRDETRLAVFSVPFPQNKFRTCFFLGVGAF